MKEIEIKRTVEMLHQEILEVAEKRLGDIPLLLCQEYARDLVANGSLFSAVYKYLDKFLSESDRDEIPNPASVTNEFDDEEREFLYSIMPYDFEVTGSPEFKDLYIQNVENPINAYLRAFDHNQEQVAHACLRDVNAALLLLGRVIELSSAPRINSSTMSLDASSGDGGSSSALDFSHDEDSSGVSCMSLALFSMPIEALKANQPETQKLILQGRYHVIASQLGIEFPYGNVLEEIKVGIANPSVHPCDRSKLAEIMSRLDDVNAAKWKCYEKLMNLANEVSLFEDEIPSVLSSIDKLLSKASQAERGWILLLNTIDNTITDFKRGNELKFLEDLSLRIDGIDPNNLTTAFSS